MGFMGLFSGKKNEGGIMDAIRCDETDFLIWKWRPAGMDANSTNKENSLRKGSSISVRPGQAAYFQSNGHADIILGPYNGTIDSGNLPVIASVVGAAFDGGSPFQAEVYYINLSSNMQMPFTIPYFQIIPAEPEYQVYKNIMVAVEGAVSIRVPKEKDQVGEFLAAWGTSDTSMKTFREKVSARLAQDVKQIVGNAPRDTGIFVMHLSSLIGQMGPYILKEGVHGGLQAKIWNDYRVIATDVIISDIRYDEESDDYIKLRQITTEQAHKFNLENEKNALLAFEIQRQTMQVDADVRNQMVRETAEMGLNHQRDSLARARQEGQFAQHMQTQSTQKRADLATESDYLTAHQVNVQADVMKTGLNNMGGMGAMNMGGVTGHMNPAGMMASMAMGAVVAGQMGRMSQQMGQEMSQNPMGGQSSAAQTPPPLPGAQAPVAFYVSHNGQQVGPYDMTALAGMVAQGQLTAQTFVWCQGMAAWAAAQTVPALASLFTVPPMPSCPPPLP